MNSYREHLKSDFKDSVFLMKLAAKMMPSAQKAKLVLTTRMLEFRDVNVLKVFT